MKTKIQDIIVPELFAPYVIQRTAEASALWTSGIVAPVDVQVPDCLTRGGSEIVMPYWSDLTGEEEILSEDTVMTTEKIKAGHDIAVLHFRGKAWSANDLSVQLSGSDPMAAVGELVAGFWARRMQKLLVASLSGAFASASMSDNVYDISKKTGDAAFIMGKTFVDATQKLGDAKSLLTAIAMHSAVEASLSKRDLIETQRDSEGNAVMRTFMGKQVITDDSMPCVNGVYTSYLFAAGAVGFKQANPKVAIETDRNALAGDDLLISRQAFILHPRGIRWKGNSVGVSPTNIELAKAENWERVYEPKQIRIVQFVHKISV